jgi:hypothetical protein
VRAPVQMTVITGKTFSMGSKRLTQPDFRRMGDEQLFKQIERSEALKNYDYVPGVPHTDPQPSREQKLQYLAAVLRARGMIPFISFNEAAGERKAVPYWKAHVEKHQASEEQLDIGESISNQGLIEVDVPETGKKQ